MAKRRLDALLADRGLFESRSRAAASVLAGEVRIGSDGARATKPGQMVTDDAELHLDERPRFVSRGGIKLANAIRASGIDPAGRLCLDVGASTGGFTTALLEAGAVRVYAVDAGHGQLLGSLRQDPRVVNLEAVNVGELGTALVPEPVKVVTVDVTYLRLCDAVAQLDRIVVAGADLVGLVKPMFELRRATAPGDRGSLDAALAVAVAGVEAAGWRVRGTMDSPVTGRRGAAEMLLWARRE
ncbi:MAG: TlyA family RNA methyltransferase [Candidatus Dormibacteraeota bacterium]|nr:TlyA family RNA methyltransferase [Candidatus Dormibacteraeota bacterium]